MYYITTKQQKIPKFFEPDTFNRSVNITNKSQNTLNEARLSAITVMDSYLRDFYDIPEKDLYKSFKIPKKKGGFREINAPKDDFLEALREVKKVLDTMYIAPHNVHAYVEGKSSITAVEQHRKSNWFLKLDIKDFFGSCDKEVILSLIKNVYPFCKIGASQIELFEKIIERLLFKGSLPQGSPVSPILTNIIMTGIDYEIQAAIRQIEDRIVYTRYSDDLLISSYKKDSVVGLQFIIPRLIKPFEIRVDKTRIGSKAGRNWNLGLMINNNNDVTVGHERKKRMNATLNNLFNDPSQYSKEDIEKINGILSYCMAVEKSYFTKMVEKYEKKYNKKYKEMLK